MPKAEAPGVVVGQPVGRPQRAVAGQADAPAGAVGEVDADRAEVTEVEHRPLVLATGAEQPGAAEGERGEGRLEQDLLCCPLIDVVALHHALPAAHLLLIASADPAGRVDVEVAADLGAAEAGAQQQLRRPQGAAGDDRRAAGADGVGTALAVAFDRRTVEQRTPTARPPSTNTRRACAPARIRAPAATARGR